MSSGSANTGPNVLPTVVQTLRDPVVRARAHQGVCESHIPRRALGMLGAVLEVEDEEERDVWAASLCRNTRQRLLEFIAENNLGR